MIFLFIVTFLFSLILIPADIPKSENRFSVVLSQGILDPSLAASLVQDGILINFYQASGRYNVITFTEDIDNFRSNRARELRLFLLERQAVSACLVKEGSFLLSIDKPKEVSLLAALEYYDDLIQRRKEEEKLSFVEFLRLYAGKGDRLSADIQETKARVS